MSDLKICLIVSDDPDDHQVLSEVIKEISKNSVVLVILESLNILAILKAKRIIPDFILVDFTMEGINGISFLKEMNEHIFLKNIPTVIYTEDPPVESYNGQKAYTFFNKNAKYSDIRKILLTLFKEHES